MNVGDEFGPSSWIVVDQERITAFADATGDHSGSTSIPNVQRKGRSGRRSATAT
jgi:hypothetical protein